MDKINDLDVVLSRHIQNLRHLQKGLDAFDFKKKMLKRLDLEIEQLTLKNDTLRDQSRKVISQTYQTHPTCLLYTSDAADE